LAGRVEALVPKYSKNDSKSDNFASTISTYSPDYA
jgi:hypothetical protein